LDILSYYKITWQWSCIFDLNRLNRMEVF